MNRLVMNIVVWAVAISGSALVAQAQPADDPAPGRAAQERPDSPEAMRAMLDRRLERTERERETVQEAIAMLDRGENIAEVRDYLRESLGDELRDRAQQWRDRREGPGEGRVPPERRPRGGDPMDDAGRDDQARGPEDPQRRGDGPPMAPERAMELLREVNPPMFDRLSRMRERNPAEFRETLRRVSMRLREFDRESREHPGMWRLRVQMFRLEREARDLARKAGAAETEAEQAAVAQLKKVVGEQFDLRVRMREQEVEDLTRRVAEVRAQIERASDGRDEIVEQRTGELIEHARRDDRPAPRGPREGSPGRRGENRGEQPPPR